MTLIRIADVSDTPFNPHHVTRLAWQGHRRDYRNDYLYREAEGYQPWYINGEITIHMIDGHVFTIYFNEDDHGVGRDQDEAIKRRLETLKKEINDACGHHQPEA